MAASACPAEGPAHEKGSTSAFAFFVLRARAPRRTRVPAPASVSPFSASPGHGDSAAPLSSLRDLRASQERCRGTHACDFKLFSSYVLTKKNDGSVNPKY